MRDTTLGWSGLDVSRIAFGTWQLGGDSLAAVDVDLSDSDLAEIDRISSREVQVEGASPEGVS